MKPVTTKRMKTPAKPLRKLADARSAVPPMRSATSHAPVAATLPFDRVVALAVGLETYQNPPNRNAVGAVDYARADATAFLETLTAIYAPDGIEVDGHLLCDAQASLTTLRETAAYLIQGLAPTDLFVFFYAGHGFHGGGDNRLTAYDTNPDNLEATTFNLGEELLRPLKTGACSRALLFVDACAETLSRAAKGRSILHSLDPEEIEALLDEGDYVGVFLSCSPGEKSYGAPQLQHGAYTAHLLKALRGEAPDALESDRWLTDVGLRDWLARTVKQYVTRTMQVRGQQTPRAILNAPHSFRIRHIETPKADPAVTLADLQLTNRDAYLEGVETGPIRSLEGFSTAKGHTVPKAASASVDAWVERLMKEDLQTELDDLRTRARRELNLSRRDTNVEWGDGGGTLDAPSFRFHVLCDQNPKTPANYRVRRRLELREGWTQDREAIDAIFATTELPRLVIEIDRRPNAFDDIADALDRLAGASGGELKENSATKRLVYSDGSATLTIDLAKGRVELGFANADGLEIVDCARRYGLGWQEPSPMLPGPAAL